MRVNVLYVVSFATDAEATVVTVGLFHRHAPQSDSALGVYAKLKEDADRTPGTLKKIEGLIKGNPPGADKIETGESTKFSDTVKKAPKTDFTTPTKVYEKRASVGMYLVSHGKYPIDMARKGAQMVKSVEPLITANGDPLNLKVVCLLRCFAAPDDSKGLHEKKLPSKAEVTKETEATQTIIENVLLRFKEVGCRPLITGWSAAISAAGPPDLDDEFDPRWPHGAKYLLKDRERTRLFPDDRRPTQDDRDTYKFGYYLNSEDKIIALPAKSIQSYYLSH